MNKAQYAEYLLSPDWKAKRARALQRAEHRCQVCYSNVRLEVHHRTYERVGHERSADLTVLCNDCHAKFHDKLSRRRREHERREVANRENFKLLARSLLAVADSRELNEARVHGHVYGIFPNDHWSIMEIFQEAGGYPLDKAKLVNMRDTGVYG